MTKPPQDLADAAATDDPDAINALGRWHIENGNPVQARECFTAAAAKGWAPAKHNLGVLATQDDDYETAIAWFREASADGWLNSTVALGAALAQLGRSSEAIAAYEIAAERGRADAQALLATLLVEEETDQAYRVARHWAEMAAAQDEPYAQAVLGRIYHEGLGVEQDHRQAAAWYLRAARLGHSGGQAWIGAAYHLGIGIEPDRVEAAYWLTLSLQQGSPIADAYLPRVLREMSPAENTILAARLRQQ